MKYDHARKIGNEGDTAKHAALAALIEEKLGCGVQAPFIYAETHAGRARYLLPAEGAWERGIGFLAGRLRENAGALEPYRRNCFSLAPEVGGEYWGSAGIAYRMIAAAGVPFRFYLWDTDPAVCDDLAAFFGAHPQVSIHRGDGYEGVEGLAAADLVLMDPFSVELDCDRILGTLDHLSAGSIDFLCWTPLVGPADQPTQIRFTKDTGGRFGTVQVQWQEPCKHTWGCRITVPSSRVALIGRTMKELGDVTGWRIGQA
ncbi:MAG: hypothetical protein V2B18_01180 [Pseudomonadota bacterium]